MDRPETYEYHRFLDEAGDTTFYGKGKLPIVGMNGVSKCFMLGMLKVKEPLDLARSKVIALQNSIGTDPYFNGIASIEKKKAVGGFFLHATDDVPEVRKMGYELLKSIDCSFEVVVARKIPQLYERKHNGKEAEFYADLLSHLLKNKLRKYDRLVLNIAKRSKCTTQNNLQQGLEKSIIRSDNRPSIKERKCSVHFNVQEPTTEPLLNVADYFCWAVQRVFERGETRYYDYLGDQISIVTDIYDSDKYAGNKHIYNKRRRLTRDNLLP